MQEIFKINLYYQYLRISLIDSIFVLRLQLSVSMFLKLKMIHMEKSREIRTIFSIFSNIGQVTMLEYILKKMNTTSMTYTHNADTVKEIKDTLSLSPASQFRHLRHLCEKGVLKKGLSRGLYIIADQWLEYGNEDGVRYRKMGR